MASAAQSSDPNQQRGLRGRLPRVQFILEPIQLAFNIFLMLRGWQIDRAAKCRCPGVGAGCRAGVASASMRSMPFSNASNLAKAALVSTVRMRRAVSSRAPTAARRWMMVRCFSRASANLPSRAAISSLKLTTEARDCSCSVSSAVTRPSRRRFRPGRRGRGRRVPFRPRAWP